MFFDFIQDVNVNIMGDEVPYAGRKDLYEYCTDAEKNATTYPETTMIKIRQAMEVFLKEILLQHGLPIEKKEKSWDKSIKRYKDKITNLTIAEMTVSAFENNIINTMQKNNLDSLRRSCNKYVHVDVKEDHKIIRVEKEKINTNVAISHLRSFYNILINIFNYANAPGFSQNKLQIGKYNIVKVYTDNANDTSVATTQYVAYYQNGTLKNYAYIRRFTKNVKAVQHRYYQRDGFTQDFIDSMDEPSTHIITGSVIETSDVCDYIYIAYKIKPETQVLSEMQQTFSVKDSVDIVLQLTEGLLSIQQGSEKVYHRNIRPRYIFLTPRKDGGYKASLGGFETAKLESEEVEITGTVVDDALAQMKKNPFVPDEAAMEEVDIFDLNWSEVDGYSMAAILAYCISPEYVQQEVDLKAFDCLSENLARLMTDMIKKPFGQKPSLQELKTGLSQELANL